MTKYTMVDVLLKLSHNCYLATMVTCSYLGLNTKLQICPPQPLQPSASKSPTGSRQLLPQGSCQSALSPECIITSVTSGSFIQLHYSAYSQKMHSGQSPDVRCTVAACSQYRHNFMSFLGTLITGASCWLQSWLSSVSRRIPALRNLPVWMYIVLSEEPRYCR